MKKTTVCLVRHGQTNWNHEKRIQGLTNNPLNETGFSQAHQIGVKLATDSLMSSYDIIISSPLKRAVQTAEVIASHLNYTDEILTHQAFVERDFGVADGAHVDDYYEQVQANNVQDMERHEIIIERVMNGLNELVATYPNQNIMVVCHSHVIKAAIIHVTNHQLDFKLPLDNTSLSLIEHANGTYQLIDYNIT